MRHHHSRPISNGGRRLLALGAVAALAAFATACGDDSDGDDIGAAVDDAIDAAEDAAEDAADAAEDAADAAGDLADDAADELADAIGAGGGGTLVFDGEEIPIASVTCVESGDDFSVGTVSDNGFRVLIDSSSTGVPNAQVLDADMRQWTPVDRGESIEIGDGTYSSPATTYSDIRDADSEVEVSFTVECP
jgi:hypothetical protein